MRLERHRAESALLDYQTTAERRMRTNSVFTNVRRFSRKTTII